MLTVAISIFMKIVISLRSHSQIKLLLWKSNGGLLFWAALCNKWQIMFNSLNVHYHNTNPSGIKEGIICKPVFFLLHFNTNLEQLLRSFYRRFPHTLISQNTVILQCHQCLSNFITWFEDYGIKPSRWDLAFLYLPTVLALGNIITSHWLLKLSQNFLASINVCKTREKKIKAGSN